MKFKKFDLALILALLLTLTYSAFTTKAVDDISNKITRFHVRANSDTVQDQELKLKVKDVVFSYVTELTKNSKNNKEANEKISENIENIIDLAQKTVYENNYDYLVTAKITYEYYNTRNYETFSLPAGYYTGLRVDIGKAEGKNWWCVLFPPLCTNIATDNKVLNDDELDIIENSNIDFRFKFYDVLSQVKKKLN